MKRVLLPIIAFFVFSCGQEHTETELNTIEKEASNEETNDLTDFSDLNLPKTPFCFDSVVKVEATCKLNSKEYSIFSSSNPEEIKPMLTIMSDQTINPSDVNCMNLGIITYELANGVSEFVEYNCHRDCHYATYFGEDENGETVIISRELTLQGIEYMTNLISNPEETNPANQ